MIASTQMRYLQIMNKENRGDFLPLFFYNKQFQFHEVLLRQTIDRNLMCQQIFLNAHTMASYLIPYLKRPITYVADFVLELPDGHKYVIDTKGMPDSTAKLKAKLFHYKFPNIDYYWVSYSKIDGGWVTYEKLKAARANRKKLKSGGKC